MSPSQRLCVVAALCALASETLAVRDALASDEELRRNLAREQSELNAKLTRCGMPVLLTVHGSGFGKDNNHT